VDPDGGGGAAWEPLKSEFGVIGALVPILYCGSLLYYFLDFSGSVQEAETDGLGPTLLGLGAVGLLFAACTTRQDVATGLAEKLIDPVAAIHLVGAGRAQQRCQRCQDASR